MNSIKYFFQLDDFKETLISYFATVVPLDFSEIFNISELHSFSPFSRIQEKLTQHEITSKKTIVYGCLQYGIKQNSVTFPVYNLEI